MLLQEKNESLFEYWISFWPTAPLFGVRWRFAHLAPAPWSFDPSAARPGDPAERPAASDASPDRQEAEAFVGAVAEAAAEPLEEEPLLARVEEEPLPAPASAGEVLEADPAFDAATAQAELARPANLFDAAPAEVDDLKRIRGVGPKVETLLNELGVYTYRQIAEFDQANLAWVDAHLGTFKGRPYRDDWTAQARELSQG